MLEQTEDMLSDTIKRVNAKVIDITDEIPDKQEKYKTLIEQTKDTRFIEGQSGNPAGRPKDIKYISEAIRERLKSDSKLRDMVVEALIRGVLAGNAPLTKEFLDRGEGKVTEVIDQTIKGQILVTPDMRAIAARELTEVKEEETKLLNATKQEENEGAQETG